MGFGGARGGGKTWASSAAAVLLCLRHQNARGLILRKGQAPVTKQYRDTIKHILASLGMKHAATWIQNERLFRFQKTGSEIHLGYITREQDYEIYQGLEYGFIALEEAVQHTAASWDAVSGSRRSKSPTMKPRRWLTCNPGGIGQQWVKERFVNPITRWPGHLWIKSTIRDCPATIASNPDYVSGILLKQPAWRVRQWLDGDWDSQAGSYFDMDFGTVIRESTDIPRYAEWYGGVDWGWNAPFATVWIATWKDYIPDATGLIFKEVDRAHVVAEVYEKGLYLDEQARKVHEVERELEQKHKMYAEECVYYGDWSIGQAIEGERETQGRTKARVWSDHGFDVSPVRRHSRVAGWQLLREMMKSGVLTIAPECKSLLNELSGAVYETPDSGDDEDMSDECPDHALDALRYAVVSIYGLDYASPSANDDGSIRTGLR